MTHQTHAPRMPANREELPSSKASHTPASLPATRPFGQRAAALSLLASLALLAACSSGPQPDNAVLSAQPVTMRAPDSFRALYCDDQPVLALASLGTPTPLSADAQFLAGLALEKQGYKLKAKEYFERALLRANAERNPAQGITAPYLLLDCGGQSAPIAADRLDMLAKSHIDAAERELALLGGAMPARPQLHAGLPASDVPDSNRPGTLTSTSHAEGPADNKTEPAPSNTQASNFTQSSAAKASAPGALTRPKSLDPLGGWFVHLASYTDRENAATGVGVLEKRYPAFSGILDTWVIELKDTRTWRIGIRLSDKEEASKLCDALKNSNQYCTLFAADQ